MGTKRERSRAVLLSTLSFLLLFNFALSFPLSWFIPPTLVQSDTLVQGCSHWRQVSHYLLGVNHVICFTWPWPWPSSCRCLSVIKDKTLAGGGSLFSSYVSMTTSRWVLYDGCQLTTTVAANPSNRLVLQRLYLLCGSVDFTLYRSLSLGSRKKTNQKPEVFTFLLLHPCWWVFQVLRAATAPPLV